MYLNRRLFLKQAITAGSAWMAAPGWPARAGSEEATLTILHTNDMHGQLQPFAMDGGRWQGMGGVAARAQLIQQVRRECAQVLLLDSGDVFQASPMFSLYKGEPEIKALNLMQYDAVTLGEHEFDGGIGNLAAQLQQANFPVVVSNYDFSDTIMHGKTLTYKTFQKGLARVGVFGIGIELNGRMASELYGNTKYLDPFIAANTTAKLLRTKEQCNLVICLSHLGDKYFDPGLPSDEQLALQSDDIDIILGAHTHRFFDAPKKYKNRRNSDVVVNQVGWGGVKMGRLDINFSPDGKKNLLGVNTVVIAEKTSH